MSFTSTLWVVRIPSSNFPKYHKLTHNKHTAVEAGHRAVIFDLLHDGVLSDVKGEGTHFVIPVIQRPIFYDVRSKPRNIAVVTGSKGGL